MIRTQVDVTQNKGLSMETLNAVAPVLVLPASTKQHFKHFRRMEE